MIAMLTRWTGSLGEISAAATVWISSALRPGESSIKVIVVIVIVVEGGEWVSEAENDQRPHSLLLDLWQVCHQRRHLRWMLEWMDGWLGGWGTERCWTIATIRKCNFDGCDRADLQPTITNGDHRHHHHHDKHHANNFDDTINTLNWRVSPPTGWFWSGSDVRLGSRNGKVWANIQYSDIIKYSIFGYNQIFNIQK